MTSAVLNDDFPLSRDDTMAALALKGIETRPFFYPMHTLPMYQELGRETSFPIAEKLARQGMNLPSSASLSYSDIQYISDVLKNLSCIS